MVAEQTKQLLSECGIPQRVISDNGIQFTGEAYQLFVYTYTFDTFDCLAASNWPPGHPRSDHHVSNPHRPDYYRIQAGREDPQCSEDRSQALT